MSWCCAGERARLDRDSSIAISEKKHAHARDRIDENVNVTGSTLTESSSSSDVGMGMATKGHVEHKTDLFEKETKDSNTNENEVSKVAVDAAGNVQTTEDISENNKDTKIQDSSKQKKLSRKKSKRIKKVPSMIDFERKVEDAFETQNIAVVGKTNNDITEDPNSNVGDRKEVSKLDNTANYEDQYIKTEIPSIININDEKSGKKIETEKKGTKRKKKKKKKAKAQSKESLAVNEEKTIVYLEKCELDAESKWNNNE